MPDVGAWNSIAHHARRRGRTARHFDAVDLYLEGYQTAAVSLYVLAFRADGDESDDPLYSRGVVCYWTGEGASFNFGDADVFVSTSEARQELAGARLVTGIDFRVRRLVLPSPSGSSR
jgi:hypothetical protein